MKVFAAAMSEFHEGRIIFGAGPALRAPMERPVYAGAAPSVAPEERRIFGCSVERRRGPYSKNEGYPPSTLGEPFLLPNPVASARSDRAVV